MVLCILLLINSKCFKYLLNWLCIRTFLDIIVLWDLEL